MGTIPIQNDAVGWTDTQPVSRFPNPSLSEMGNRLFGLGVALPTEGLVLPPGRFTITPIVPATLDLSGGRSSALVAEPI
jgi:hypothetical protein